MKNLVLEEFDLHEFNKWMLDIQKLEQKINCVLNIFGVWCSIDCDMHYIPKPYSILSIAWNDLPDDTPCHHFP